MPPDFDIDPRPAHGYMMGTWNPGLLFARATKGSLGMLRAWMIDFATKGTQRLDFGGRGNRRPGVGGRAMKKRTRESAMSSQTEMNAFLRSALSAKRARSDHQLFVANLRRPLPPSLPYSLTSSLPSSATLGLLPAHQFGSFAATHLVREAQLYGVAPFCTHATQIVGQGIVFRKNNVNSMGRCTHPDWCLGEREVGVAVVKAFTQRHFGQWLVPDESSYFAGGFLTYTPREHRSLRIFAVTSSGSNQWDRHLALLQAQLQEVQAALALAMALNRTLVLPRLLCSCVYSQWPFINSGNRNCQPIHLQACSCE